MICLKHTIKIFFVYLFVCLFVCFQNLKGQCMFSLFWIRVIEGDFGSELLKGILALVKLVVI